MKYSKMLSVLLALIIEFSTLAVAKGNEMSWFEQKALGDPDRPYLYYPDEKDKKGLVQHSLPQTGEQAQVQLEQLQQSVKLARALALMNPSEDNVKNYIQKQEAVMSVSATFTDQWRRVLWKNPGLDYSQSHRPTDSTAIRVYDQAKTAQNVALIESFAKNYGLVFFVKSDCQYCHAFAPLLKSFQTQYNIRIMTVSLDGVGVPPFNDVLPDNGIAARLNIQVTPSLYVADTFNKQYIPLSFGVLSQSELEERIVALMTPVGKSF